MPHLKIPTFFARQGTGVGDPVDLVRVSRSFRRQIGACGDDVAAEDLATSQRWRDRPFPTE